MERDDPEPAEWQMKNGQRARRKAGSAVPVRLCGSGVLVGFVHQVEPERPDVGGDGDNRQSLALVAPHGEVSRFSEVADEGIGARNGGRFPRLMAQYGHRLPH